MRRINDILVIVTSAIIFSLLFHNRSVGINLVVYEILAVSFLWTRNQYDFKNKKVLLAFLALIVTLSFTIVNHSILSYFVHTLVVVIFIGILVEPQFRSLLTIVKYSLRNFYRTQFKFKNQLIEKNRVGNIIFKNFRRIKILTIPLVIILAFIFLYSLSSPQFADIVMNSVNFIFQKIEFTLYYFDIEWLWTFFIGVIITNYWFLRVYDSKFWEMEQMKSDFLTRNRFIRRGVKILSLKNEYRSAVFLFAMLNILLLTMNVSDVKLVWFDFEWKGTYLKQFVHEGTYYLIASLLISMGLVLYYFRGNLNFYSKNKLLKWLVYIWILQNVILAISVSMRNLYYIQYFALAYKRIAIIFFLLLTIFALITVILKIKNRMSIYYLLRLNSFALVLLLILASSVNWDVFIAKYNFRNAERSFVHLNYLSDLSNSALPWLNQDLETLEKLNNQQMIRFSILDSSGSYRSIYMSPKEYFKKIENRKIEFIKKWNSQDWLSWNYADYKAYRLIRKSN